ncbi:aryl-alcohol dehydrogenase-like predicted oxidoreductase [Chitinophaga dinghuensis]|uniref:Aryl-alcohol dehydrogenase-like predicted oxidoreductase n=1 Tax=Chitinophaga dinghuensis TaxID=1539050 RepID=A0A327VV26_9BACT|nr:aldo/keto reductase [Chitinophaga dinghuensis]RAJ79332.1 aryl-alcohol dehydrogenase-like predicted oxidoreductase [Chitinophaga dinghuensis]
MEKRKLGNSGLEVAPLAFGGNVFGWSADETTSFALLDEFVANSFNLVDTADVYSRWVPGNKGGESESILGRWMKDRGNRDKVIVATKVGADMGEGMNVSKSYILKRVEDSLQRLQTDYIDLYQTHYDNEETPVEETLEAYDTLIKAGKIRAIGASNMSPARLLASLRASESHGYPRYETFQPEYNLYDREKYEQLYADICVKGNISVINYYSLASGFLSGKYRNAADSTKSAARGQKALSYLTPRGIRILEALDICAAKHKTTPSAISLAWLLTRPAVAAPIASATTKEQLHELMHGVTMTLDQEDLALLNKSSAY